MKINKETYQNYLKILRAELIPAGGCTEPIAIAYAAAVARETLGNMPERIKLQVSGNLIKNAKGVFIPNGGDLKGVGASAIMGVVGGDAKRKLEVLCGMKIEHLVHVKELIRTNFCEVSILKGVENLHLIVEAFCGKDYVLVELKNSHTNITRIERNGEVLLDKTESEYDEDSVERRCLNIEDIYDFAQSCDLDDVKDLIGNQIECNMKIAEVGLTGKWGLNIGKILFEESKLCQAYAAAASDARMNGCNLPVVIVSGSGNQGATVSLPVIIYAREIDASQEKMYRALILSNLIAIQLKLGIGRLSAYCGVVSAATASGCAFTYLDDGSIDQIKDTLTNSVANISGMICDGAKPSCAAKIAVSLDAAMLAHELAMHNRVFQNGEGIVMKDVEETIQAVGKIANLGMIQTDNVILDIMTKKEGRST